MSDLYVKKNPGAIRRIRQVVLDPLTWVAIGLLCVYLGYVALRPSGVFWSLDEGGKFIYLQSVIKTGDPSAALEYPGRYLDRNLHFVPLLYWSRAGDQIYSWWPVAFPLMSLPFYQLLGWMGLYVIPAVSGALCALFTGAIIRQIRPTARWLAVGGALITGLATPLAFYSTVFWEHTPATASFLGAVWSVLQAQQKRQARWIVVAGVLASLATCLRTEMAGLVAGVGLALLLWRWRWAIYLGASYTLASLPWLLLNWRLMGHVISRQWIPGSVSLDIPLFGGLREVGLWLVPYILFNAPRVAAFDVGTTTLVLGTVLVGAALLVPFLRGMRWLALVAYGGLILIGARVLLSSDGYRSVHGFVLVAPHVAFAVWLYTSRTNWHDTLYPAILLAACATFGIAYFTEGWVAAGGSQWGPRYLITLYPLLVVASVKGWEAIRLRVHRTVARGMLIAYCISVLIGWGYQVRGAYAAIEAAQYYGQTQQALHQLDAEPVVTPCIWLPMIMPELYWTGSVFSVGDGAQLKEWATEAHKVGIVSGYSVDIDLCSTAFLDEIAVRRAANPSGIRFERFEIDQVR